jgi:hypothetical protein
MTSAEKLITQTISDLEYCLEMVENEFRAGNYDGAIEEAERMMDLLEVLIATLEIERHDKKR